MIRSSSAAAPAVRFRRPDGERGVRKSVRRLPARLRQFLVLSAAAGAVFFVLATILIFGMTWTNFDVRDVRILAADPDVRAAAERMAAAMPWGNIFVLDADAVRRRFEARSWIREARVRKILPGAVEVEIEPRVPVAILAKIPPVLVDADGVEIAEAEEEPREKRARQHARRPAAHVDGFEAHRGSPGEESIELGDAPLDHAGREPTRPGTGTDWYREEIAVPAPRGAERHVDVEREAKGVRDRQGTAGASTGTSPCRRCGPRRAGPSCGCRSRRFDCHRARNIHRGRG